MDVEESLELPNPYSIKILSVAFQNHLLWLFYNLSSGGGGGGALALREDKM